MRGCHCVTSLAPLIWLWHHSVSCVCHCCLTWFSVGLLTQNTTHWLMTRMAYPVFFLLSVFGQECVVCASCFLVVSHCDLLVWHRLNYILKSSFFLLANYHTLSCPFLSSYPSSRRLPCRWVPVSNGRPVHSHALALWRWHGLYGPEWWEQLRGCDPHVWPSSQV